jgi:ABC-type transport system involved in multi-copper enzyme maturation permease subunit
MASARRKRVYAWRALFVLLLLVGLALIWAPAGHLDIRPQDLSIVGQQFFVTVVSIQLVVVLLAGPAATAGAICVDKGRGALLHALITDLTEPEIVAGKLGARLAPVLALIAGGLPVMALSGLLGGIDPWVALGAYLVTGGVAVFGCSVALLFSVWAKKPHQALLPTYALLGLWSAYPILRMVLFWPLAPSPWLGLQAAEVYSNPFLAAFAPLINPAEAGLLPQAVFLGVALVLSWVLVARASRTLRPVLLRQAARPARRGRPGFAARLVGLIPGPALDGNPVLWREWHRKKPTRWTGRLWTAYAVVSTLASLAVIASFYANPGRGWTQSLPAQVNAWEVAIGLLLLSVSAATALAEERERGSLDVIMATPLATRTILWGKWWGTFAIVPRLAILPIWVAAGLAMISGEWVGLVLMIGLILAYSAAITSLGLALATWVPSLGRAVGTSVLCYIGMSIGPLFLIAFFRSVRVPYGQMIYEWYRDRFLLASPYFGVSITTEWAGELGSLWHGGSVGFTQYVNALDAITWPCLWIGIYALAAAVLMGLTLASFDRCMGRLNTMARRPVVTVARSVLTGKPFPKSRAGLSASPTTLE